MKTRIPLVIANWKMHKTALETTAFIESLHLQLPSNSTQVMIAPPYTAIEAAVQAALNTKLIIGAQNLHAAESGAFTGEISAQMLQEIGAQFVLIGHSERRHIFGETDLVVHRKLKTAVEKGFIPILCVGETLQQREQGKATSTIADQLKQALKGIEPSKLIIAYEPVWAIGTGLTALPEMAENAHQLCRDVLTQLWGKHSADAVRIVYGGSVNPQNVTALMHMPSIDGVLVGNASLNIQNFLQIIQGTI
jgi:triosephosphate isomerase